MSIKLFECIVAEEYQSTSPEDMYKFGIKSHHSTGLCTSILKRTVNYTTLSVEVMYFYVLLISQKCLTW